VFRIRKISKIIRKMTVRKISQLKMIKKENKRRKRDLKENNR